MGSSGEHLTTGASLMQPCRVYEEGLRVVKTFSGRKGVKLIPLLIQLPAEEAPAYPVPAAVVIRRVASVNLNYWA